MKVVKVEATYTNINSKPLYALSPFAVQMSSNSIKFFRGTILVLRLIIIKNSIRIRSNIIMNIGLKTHIEIKIF